jgi:flagellar basal-body rod modification protein FlgD
MTAAASTISPASLLQKAAGAAAATGPLATSAGGTASSGGTSALDSLAGNFTNFLSLLMTQLKNQDPTQPMDTDQFTTEIVQFTGVQQQVKTNSTLSQLIQLTQTGQALDGARMIGQVLTASSSGIALQNGRGDVSFTGTAGSPVAIAVVDAGGHTVRTATLTAQGGTQTWHWDGLSDGGTQEPDGAYGIAVESTDANGNPLTLPTSVTGTITGLSTGSNGTTLSMGGLPVPLSAIAGLGH